jgi:3-oxoacyl-[acyl-carrier-protein] synthase II
MIRNIVITGVGIISPLGLGKEFLSANHNTSIIGAMHTDLIPDFNDLDYMDSKTSKHCQRVEKLALASSRLALTDAGFEFNTFPEARVGVALGSMTSNLRAAAIFDQLVLQGEAGFCDPALIPSGIMNSLSGIVSIKNGIRGFHVPVAAGEASGMQAIQFALMHIETGRVEAALAGGIEEICEEFNLTNQVKNFPYPYEEGTSNAKPMGAFAPVYPLSEAAAVLLLESASNAARRGADAYAECVGYGSSYGSSDWKTALRAAIRALERTFRNPEIEPVNTDLIFASFDEWQAGSSIEREALKQFFGYKMPEITSIKSFLGDNLGASGALQIAAAAIAIKSPVVIKLNYNNASVTSVPAQVGQGTKEIRQVLVSSFSQNGHLSFLVLRKIND